MSKKAKPTKTMNPLHSEDLDPHRFEDLVRNLIYDFKIWQSIEAIGRGGGDEGFDIRAWERIQEVTNKGDKDEELGIHPMDGNLWMIQCKREKEIGPSKIKKIVEEGVNKKDSLYGYILVAPVNFSKRSHDVFRDELVKRGVMEFHLWGRSELEDMLYMPKNDHILFAFFGISLVTRRRSRSSEIKFVVNNKNKLLRILSGGNHRGTMHQSILIRDYKDLHYPWKEEYKDFDKKPRWSEHIVTGYHPLGLIVQVREYYAFADLKKKKWDYTKAIDLVSRESDQENGDSNDYKEQEKVRDFWRHLPRSNQARFAIKGLIAFEDILVIDDKGDVRYGFPHIFVDFLHKKGPFRGFWYSLKMDGQQTELEDEYKQIKVFPKNFPKIKKGKVYKNKSIQWDEETLRLFTINSDIANTLFDVEGKYDFLKPRDTILVAGAESSSGEKTFLEITYRYETTVKKYLEGKNAQYVRKSIERQIGRKVKNEEKITIFEFDRTYGWQFRS